MGSPLSGLDGGTPVRTQLGVPHVKIGWGFSYLNSEIGLPYGPVSGFSQVSVVKNLTTMVMCPFPGKSPHSAYTRLLCFEWSHYWTKHSFLSGTQFSYFLWRIRQTSSSITSATFTPIQVPLHQSIYFDDEFYRHRFLPLWGWWYL